MPFEVQGAKADPTLDVVVDEVGTGRIRLTTYSGTVLIGPAHVGGLHMTVMGGGPATASMGFFVPEGRPLEPGEDVAIHGEAAMTQVVVETRIENMDLWYGIGEVSARIVEQPDGQRWPALDLVYYGNQPLGVRYRVVLRRPAPAG